jgi:ABC-type spermidine/putrescine transport system permease subunit II
MSDYIALIGILALMFVPLYVPIAVTIIGAIRSRREGLVASPVVDPRREVVTSAHVDRASVNTPAAAAAIARGRDAVPVTARPVVEPV